MSTEQITKHSYLHTDNSSRFIEINNLTKHFPVQRGFWSRTVSHVQALNNVSLKIQKGEIIGIVGESGCGKSTLGKLILRLLEPTSGEVLYKGKNIYSISKNDLRALRQKLQIVFQNPYSSLNPRMKVREIISEPIQVHKIFTDKGSIQNRVTELLNLVGIEPQLQEKYAQELSGGQRQRIAIARALSLNPEFLVLDEPVSALDVSVQAQILNLLIDLHKKLNLTYLFISHNLSVVSYISTQIAVMYLGHIVEIGLKEKIMHSPKHPYTVALLSAAPQGEIARRRDGETAREQRTETARRRDGETAKEQRTETAIRRDGETAREQRTEPAIRRDGERTKDRIILTGEIPDPSNPPSGCVFRTRCPIAKERCATEIPLLKPYENQLVSCHFPGEL